MFQITFFAITIKMIRGFFFTFFERNEEISDIIECDKMFE
jgi:hypothetical protein